MEQNINGDPWITVEFGGFMDPGADGLAYESLRDFILAEDLFADEAMPLAILRHPYRLEIDGAADLHYSSTFVDDSDATVVNTIDQLNFHRVEAGTCLGWLGSSGLKPFRLLNNQGENSLTDYFRDDNGMLVTVQSMTVFMATTDASIAREDCLLYLTPDDKPSPLVG